MTVIELIGKLTDIIDLQNYIIKKQADLIAQSDVDDVFKDLRQLADYKREKIKSEID